MYRKTRIRITEFSSGVSCNKETTGSLTYLVKFQTTKYQFLFSSVWKPYKSLPKCRIANFSCTHNSVPYQLTVPSFIIWIVLLLRIVPYLNILSPRFHSPHGATLLILDRFVDLRNVMCRMYLITKKGRHRLCIIIFCSLRQLTKILKEYNCACFMYLGL